MSRVIKVRLFVRGPVGRMYRVIIYLLRKHDPCQQIAHFMRLWRNGRRANCVLRCLPMAGCRMLPTRNRVSERTCGFKSHQPLRLQHLMFRELAQWQRKRFGTARLLVQVQHSRLRAELELVIKPDMLNVASCHSPTPKYLPVKIPYRKHNAKERTCT